MAISEREFSAALAENIPRFTDIGSQDGDKRLVETLTKYTMGLLKEQAAPLSTSDSRAKLSFLLHEFFEGSTGAFVDWLEGFVRINGMPFGVSAPASRMKSTLAAAPGVSKQESNTRDIHTARDAGLDATGRERSRSPATANRAAPRGPAQRHRAMFEDAVRRTGGHADAGVHPPNIKLEPRSDSPELIVMSPPAGMKVEGAQNAGQPKLGGNRQHGGGGERDPGSVVIMNIHFEATPEQVGLFFDEYCKGVVRVTILKNTHGMPKGYAYMELADEDTAQIAMKMSGVQFMGRKIKVVPKLKKPPPQALGPPWLLKSLPFMQMMPYMMSAYPFSSGSGAPPVPRNRNRMQRPVGNRMDAAHRAMNFTSPSKRIEFGTSDVWIRGVHDTLGAAVGV